MQRMSTVMGTAFVRCYGNEKERDGKNKNKSVFHSNCIVV
jgi:hypothetical protein